MDSGTIIITIVFLAIVTLPFAVTGYSRNKKKKYLLRKLNEAAQAGGFTITYHEFCSDFIIGLDDTANHVFFHKKREANEFSVEVNLAGYKNCSIFSSKHEVETKKEKVQVLDKLGLCFYPKDKTMPNVLIEIYNDEYDSLNMSGELQLVEKWEKQLNDRMKKLTNPKFASILKTEQPVQSFRKNQKNRLVKV